MLLWELIRRPVLTLRRVIRYHSVPAVYLGENTLLTRTVFGHEIFLDTRDLSLTPHLVLTGVWEYPTTRVLRSKLRPGMSYVEIGTNVGYYAVLAASIVGPEGRVAGFEANPRMAQLASRSLHLNGYDRFANITPVAIADKPGRLTLHTHRDFFGSSTVVGELVNIPILEEAPAEGRGALEVQAVTLDEALAGTDGRADFIKMDIEGAEPLAIRGMSRLLQSNRVLRMIIEFSPAMIAGAGVDPGQFLDSLAAMGFRMGRITDSGTVAWASPAQLTTHTHSDLYLERS